MLDQYKEMKIKDPSIREKFDTYRFADYKEKYSPAHACHHGEHQAQEVGGSHVKGNDNKSLPQQGFIM